MKNKTKKIIRLICGVLLIVMLQTIGITYAKYIAKEEGTGHAEVAKWAFEISKDGEQTKTVNLASSVYEDTLINEKMAPGTRGSFDITIDATGSEVDLNYDIKFINEKNKPDNLVFTYGGVGYDSLSKIQKMKGDIKYDDKDRTKTFTIFWEWAYETGLTPEQIEANNVIDTQNANSITQYTFDIVATGTQVD